MTGRDFIANSWIGKRDRERSTCRFTRQVVTNRPVGGGMLPIGNESVCLTQKDDPTFSKCNRLCARQCGARESCRGAENMVAETTPELELQPTNDPRPRRVLVVDDDETQVFALRHRLEKLGYEVASAFTGRHAVAAAHELVPDLVLLDLRLPDATGFEICERLADSPSTCGTPIIILSAMEGPDIVRQARRVGCEFYIRKPYDPNVLLTLIEHALQSSENWE